MLPFDIVLLLGNLSNVTGQITNEVSSLVGNWGLIVGAAILIVGAFIVLYLLKNLIANAVVGIVALLILKFVIGLQIDLSPLVILISVLGGMGGVAAVLIATFLGWLK